MSKVRPTKKKITISANAMNDAVAAPAQKKSTTKLSKKTTDDTMLNDDDDDDDVLNDDDVMGDDEIMAKLSKATSGATSLKAAQDSMQDAIEEVKKKKTKTEKKEQPPKDGLLKPTTTTTPAAVPGPTKVSRKVMGLSKDGEMIEKVRSKKERLKMKKDQLLAHLETTMPLDTKDKKAQDNIFGKKSNAFGSFSADLNSALDGLGDAKSKNVHDGTKQSFRNTKQTKKALEQDKNRFQAVIQHCGSIDSIKSIVQMQMDNREDANTNKKSGKKGNNNNNKGRK